MAKKPQTTRERIVAKLGNALFIIEELAQDRESTKESELYCELVDLETSIRDLQDQVADGLFFLEGEKKAKAAKAGGR